MRPRVFASVNLLSTIENQRFLYARANARRESPFELILSPMSLARAVTESPFSLFKYPIVASACIHRFLEM
jgi:hypothetical protein